MPNDSLRRPSPDQLLARIQFEERRSRRGRLKVFLGYTAGVGKSFQMLDEGRRRSERGEDVVVCAAQPKYTVESEAILHNLESIPTLKTGDAESIDVYAVIRRQPQVALIDGLAYDNPPGSLNPHRWQDVEQLLEARISVVTTINLQYLEKLREEVERITGKRASCSIPRGFLDSSADEIVVVDAPAIKSRLHRVTPTDRAALLAEHKLCRLRELALLVAASVVDHQLESYLRSHGVDQSWGVQERILVFVTPRSSAAQMLESGRRNADRFQGEFYVAYVQQPALSQEDRAILQQNLDYAGQIGAQVEVLNGPNATDAILKFAREKGITQIFIGRNMREGKWSGLWRNAIERLILATERIDVIVYPQ
jgi:two-component system, OmpR family, sensor histidine kinase KdpD